MDMRAELALRAPLNDLRHQSALCFWLAPHPGAPQHAADIAAFQEHQIKRQFRNLAGGKADHEIAALPRQRAHGGLRIGTADRIVDDVDAVLAAKRLERTAQIFARVVHRFVGAVLAGEGELVVRGRAGDDARAHDLADLDRREPGAAGGAEHGQRFAGFEFGALSQRV